MKDLKRTFIPPNFRPRVKGEKLDDNPKITAKDELFNFTTIKEEKSGVVCLSVKDDGSQTNILKKVLSESNSPTFFFYYDDLGETWNFSFFNGKLIIYDLKIGQKIIPTGIYNRMFFPEQTHTKFHLFNNFIRAIEFWNGPVIGAMTYNFHNSSKAYQLTTTIRSAIKKHKKKIFSFPKSFFVKGIKNFDKMSKIKRSLIVKSCSGIRSEVAIFDQFNKWEKKNLDHLPIFFQKLCSGPDIRVHWLEGDCWPIILYEKKGSIDFRYAKKRGHFERFLEEPELKIFCETVAKSENLKLVGMDLIKIGKYYYCLECNPSPGWGGFHRAAGDEPLIAKKILHNLK